MDALSTRGYTLPWKGALALKTRICKERFKIRTLLLREFFNMDQNCIIESYYNKNGVNTRQWERKLWLQVCMSSQGESSLENRLSFGPCVGCPSQTWKWQWMDVSPEEGQSWMCEQLTYKHSVACDNHNALQSTTQTEATCAVWYRLPKDMRCALCAGSCSLASSAIPRFERASHFLFCQPEQTAEWSG